MRKQLPFKAFLAEHIKIRTSKENDGIILSQNLKYTPTKCEDCDRVCPIRRTVTSKISHQLVPAEWLHQCNVCRQYYNPKTKAFNTSWIGRIRQKYSK